MNKIAQKTQKFDPQTSYPSPQTHERGGGQFEGRCFSRGCVVRTAEQRVALGGVGVERVTRFVVTGLLDGSPLAIPISRANFLGREVGAGNGLGERFRQTFSDVKSVQGMVWENSFVKLSRT